MEKIRAHQFDYIGLRVIRDKVLSGETKEASLDANIILRIGSRVCGSRIGDWIRFILSKWTIQDLEDILHACFMEFGGQWKQLLAMVEFVHNNSYNSSLKMASFEDLYGRHCPSPVGWILDESRGVHGDLEFSKSLAGALIRTTISIEYKWTVIAPSVPFQYRSRGPTSTPGWEGANIVPWDTKFYSSLSSENHGSTEIIEKLTQALDNSSIIGDLSAVVTIFNMKDIRRIMPKLPGELAVVCAHRKVPSKDHNLVYWVAGALLGLSVLLEKKDRCGELALYVLPRAADSLWYILVNCHLLPDIKNVEIHMFVMDFTSSGRAWIEKIGEKLESLCSEVDARSQNCPLERLDHSRGLYPWHGIDTLPAGVTDAEVETSNLSLEQNTEEHHPASELLSISVQEDNKNELFCPNSSCPELAVENMEGTHVDSSLSPQVDKKMNMSVEGNLEKALSFSGKSSALVASTGETLKMTLPSCKGDKGVEGPAKSSSSASSVESLEFDPS
ncbi:putative vignain-like [Capsicum annuum]|nr:putative vignain-like [Capsicum annuum]